MRLILMFLFPIFLFGQQEVEDTLYPIQLRLNNRELNCFKPEQSYKIYRTYLLYENTLDRLNACDSMNQSLIRENDKMGQIIENDKQLLDFCNKKVKLYTDIVQEKDNQIKLKDREKLVTELKSKKTNYTLEIFVLLAGGLLGYTIGHK